LEFLSEIPRLVRKIEDFPKDRVQSTCHPLQKIRLKLPSMFRESNSRHRLENWKFSERLHRISKDTNHNTRRRWYHEFRLLDWEI